MVLRSTITLDEYQRWCRIRGDGGEREQATLGTGGWGLFAALSCTGERRGLRSDDMTCRKARGREARGRVHVRG